ncbi:MAG: hypothetical protein V4563_14350 [Pseudomonadota bacterium]
MKTICIFLSLLMAIIVLADIVPPPAASVAEVNAGVVKNKYVSPYTLGLADGPTNGVTATQATNIANAQIASAGVVTTNGFYVTSTTISSNLYCDLADDPTWQGHYTLVFSNTVSVSYLSGNAPWMVWRKDSDATKFFSMNDPNEGVALAGSVTVCWTFGPSNDTGNAFTYISQDAVLPSFGWWDNGGVGLTAVNVHAHFATTNTAAIYTNTFSIFKSKELASKFVYCNWGRGDDQNDGLFSYSPKRMFDAAISLCATIGQTNIFIAEGTNITGNSYVLNAAKVIGQKGTTVVQGTDTGFSPFSIGNGSYVSGIASPRFNFQVNSNQTVELRDSKTSLSTIDCIDGTFVEGVVNIYDCSFKATYDLQNFIDSRGGGSLNFYGCDLTVDVGGTLTPAHGVRVGGQRGATNLIYNFYNSSLTLISTYNAALQTDGGNCIVLFNNRCTNCQVHFYNTVISTKGCTNLAPIVGQNASTSFTTNFGGNAVYWHDSIIDDPRCVPAVWQANDSARWQSNGVVYRITSTSTNQILDSASSLAATQLTGTVPTSVLPYRSGITNLANLSTSQAVLFTTPFSPDVGTNYSVWISFDTVIATAVGAATTSKTTNGFTLTISAGIAGTTLFDYGAFPYR